MPADAIIARFFKERRYLGSHDRGFMADTVYDVLRGVLRYDRILSDLTDGGDSDRYASLFLVAYIVENGPEVDEGDLREGTGLRSREIATVEERMRESASRIDELPEPERSALRHGLPEWFVERVFAQVGEEEGEPLLASLNRQAPITVRANTLQTTRDRLAEALAAQNIPSIHGEYSPDALLLQKRLNARGIPEFKNGWFELQDEGSQMLSRILDPHPNWRVFDACAGGGGKTLHIAAIMKGRGEVIAHDVNTRRLEEIKPRLKRSGVQNVRVMGNSLYQDRQGDLAGTFDAVMIDAPCTGAGVLRRNPGARLTLDEAMVDRLVDLQGEIIEEYARLVKTGGLLLYATCSLLREENEAQVERFMDANRSWILESAKAPEVMVTPEGYFRSFPHRHGADGFFGALLRRGG